MAWLDSITNWLNRPAPTGAAAGCYAAIVRQARQPEFYRDLEVPDTPQGRFELIMLHAYLVMRQIHRDKAFNQKLFDLMFADFDINLRELGVGDLGVGKRVKNWAQAFQGRAAAYDGALSDQETLAAAFGRNIGSADDRRLAVYTQAASSLLGGQDDSDIKAGHIRWPRITEE